MDDLWKKTIEQELDVFLKENKSCENISKKLLIYSLEWLSVGYFSALYMAGKKLAKNSLVEKIESNDMVDVNKFLENFFVKACIGKLKLVGVSDQRYVYRLEECNTCRDIRPVGREICYFEAGIIAGVLEAKLKKRVVIRETLCGGLGDDYCEFIARVG